jgi:hypothetical protein
VDGRADFRLYPRDSYKSTNSRVLSFGTEPTENVDPFGRRFFGIFGGLSPLSDFPPPTRGLSPVTLCANFLLGVCPRYPIFHRLRGVCPRLPSARTSCSGSVPARLLGVCPRYPIFHPLLGVCPRSPTRGLSPLCTLRARGLSPLKLVIIQKLESDFCLLIQILDTPPSRSNSKKDLIAGPIR